MNKASISFSEMKADLLKDEEFKTEYNKLQPRYEAIEQIIQARKKKKIKNKLIEIDKEETKDWPFAH